MIGKIGSVDTSAATDHLLGTADEDMVVNICLCNRTSGSAVVRIAIGTGSSPADADYLEYDVTVPTKGVLERTGIAISEGEKIWVRSDVADVSARAHGLPAG